MLYLHIILLKRRVDLEGSGTDEGHGGALYIAICANQNRVWSTTDSCEECVAGKWKDPYYWGIYRYRPKSTRWANAERRLLPLTSWRPAWHQPPPRPAECATGRWVAGGWPACLTSVAAPRRCCCSPQRLCRWRRSCRSCHSPRPSPPLALSGRGHKAHQGSAGPTDGALGTTDSIPV